MKVNINQKVDAIKIKVVKNGFVVDGLFSQNTRYTEQIVFESFETLVEWMRENLKEIKK